MACGTAPGSDSSGSVAVPTTSTTAGPVSTSQTATSVSVLGGDAPSGLVFPELPGSFPSTLDVGEGVLHLRAVYREISAPEFQTDFWRQPATGRFRKAVTSQGDERSSEFSSVQVFTGGRLQEYQLPSGEAYDWSYAAYQASALEDRIDPFSEEQGEIGERVAELRQVIEKGLLYEAGREEAGGREIVRYEGKFSEDYPFRRVVLADAATGFPLDDRMFREDGVLYSCRLADLEVVDDADLDALFSLTFPAGVKPSTDEQLPQMPEQAIGLEACLQELAWLSAEVPFSLYYLGDSSGDLPLHMVRPGTVRDGRVLSVNLYYRDPDSTGLASVALYVYDPDLVPDLRKPFAGWRLVRTVEVDGTEDKIYDPGGGGLIYVATRGGTTIDLFAWNDSGPASESELIEVAKSLKSFAR